jgi:hypothetical protein
MYPKMFHHHPNFISWVERSEIQQESPHFLLIKGFFNQAITFILIAIKLSTFLLKIFCPGLFCLVYKIEIALQYKQSYYLVFLIQRDRKMLRIVTKIFIIGVYLHFQSGGNSTN